MPSWNIHTAHVERLLREEGAARLGVRDANAFLLGNLAPDIYVGYMVPDISLRIDYKLTHHTIREHIPLPRYDEFWEFYIAGQDKVSDMTLGAWAHLVADHVYNAHTRAYLASIGMEAGEQARIGKQGDFALFSPSAGRSPRTRSCRTTWRAPWSPRGASSRRTVLSTSTACRTTSS